MATLSFCRGRNVRLGHSQPLNAEGLNFAFPRGKLTALVGPNGAGKTTLLRAILGESTLLSGEIDFFDDISVKRIDPVTLARTVALVPQEHFFPADLTVTDLLRLAYLPRMGIFRKAPPESRDEISRMVENLGLTKFATRALRSLSTGERQRVFLARALLQRPKLLILDEPTNHLDPGGVYAFWNLLDRERRERSLEVLVTTHDLAFVEKFAGWVCAMKEGSIAYDGEAKPFFDDNWVSRIFGKTIADAR